MNALTMIFLVTSVIGAALVIGRIRKMARNGLKVCEKI